MFATFGFYPSLARGLENWCETWPKFTFGFDCYGMQL